MLKRAVDELVARTGLPVAFGGYEIDDAVKVSAITGARTASLEGLVVHKSRGLGGRAIVERRPRLAIDYRTSRNITHDYDRHVLGEGISTLFAVPILVGGETRGVLYCGSWLTSPFGDQVARSAFAVAAELGTELRVRDEVARQVSLTQESLPRPPSLRPRARNCAKRSWNCARLPRSSPTRMSAHAWRSWKGVLRLCPAMPRTTPMNPWCTSPLARPMCSRAPRWGRPMRRSRRPFS